MTSSVRCLREGGDSGPLYDLPSLRKVREVGWRLTSKLNLSPSEVGEGGRKVIHIVVEIVAKIELQK